MKNQKGFSLIELLIVVVIIGIIAAIAIPNLLASRRAANEASATSSMRTFHGANSTWFATKGKNKTYAPTVAALKTEELIDATLVAAFTGTDNPKSGYNFAYTAPGTDADKLASFKAVGTPASKTGVTRTGSREFTIDQSGVITDTDTDGTPATTTTTTP